MARIIEIGHFDEPLRRRLIRSFQSGHIAFLIGSGASLPAIPTAGPIEAEIAALLTNGDVEAAYSKMFDFLAGIQEPTNKLIADVADTANSATLQLYAELLRVIEQILLSRRTTLLPRQATIFSTNYDLFVECASSACPTTILNDGFSRAVGLRFGMQYSSRNFFRTVYNTGNLYEYKVEIPSINLVKLHGSISWQKAEHGIVFRPGKIDVPLAPDYAAKKKFVEEFAVVLPQASKFRETLMDRIYYDALRIYANTLDRENTVLIAFGFSFGDEHIREITLRALKNPTLRLMIFAHDEHNKDSYVQIFEQYSNVEIVSAKEGYIDFEAVNRELNNILHAPAAAA